MQIPLERLTREFGSHEAHMYAIARRMDDLVGSHSAVWDQAASLRLRGQVVIYADVRPENNSRGDQFAQVPGQALLRRTFVGRGP